MIKSKPKPKIFTMDQKIQVKNSLRTILMYYGCKPGKFNWSCIPSRHTNPKNDLSLKNNVCCCHCGLKGDSFSVIAELEGLSLKNDFAKIIEKGLEIIGSDCGSRSRELTWDKGKNITNKSQVNRLIISYDFTNIIANNYKKSYSDYNYNYFYKRRLTKEIIDKYKILVKNPRHFIPTKFVPKLNNIHAYRYVIPVWENGKVVNCILRRDDNLSKDNHKILNLKDLPLSIFNLDYIKQSSLNDVLFITEGIFDALSFESIDLKGIALNSTSMSNYFLKRVEENKEQLKKNKVLFFIAFDNDKAGKEYALKMIKGLRELNIRSVSLRLTKYNDINEFFVKDQLNFIKGIEGCLWNILK